MMEISTVPENSAATTNRENEEGSGGVGDGRFGEDEIRTAEENDRYSAGNRWPRQETLALLQIRSDMDVAFKDSGLKAPLWEEVTRKLAELGYHRSAKKCKEKFENIYKYHRRTKEGRSGRPNGKNYRFFEQLEALEDQSLLQHSSPVKIHATPTMSASINPINVVQDAIPCSIHNPSTSFLDTSTSTTSTSSKESEGTHKKKRKLTEFFERLMREVIEKQENLQKQFIEAIEKCEQDRIAREDAWKMQELARIKRERELLVQERSIAAAKDAAVLAFLQKFSEQTGTLQLPENQIAPLEQAGEKQENSNGPNAGEIFSHMSSSRWPRDEVEALIRLRTNLDLQYQENGPKGPLWEEISTAMKKLGYDRGAKRCKEKWENMNKYFKRVKESKKIRPDDSKTCPYFHQLDAIYKEKTKRVDPSVTSGYEMKPEELLMHMMGAQEERQRPESDATEDGESENVDQNQQLENQADGENEDEDDDEGGGYQIVANNPSMAIMG